MGEPKKMTIPLSATAVDLCLPSLVAGSASSSPSLEPRNNPQQAAGAAVASPAYSSLTARDLCTTEGGAYKGSFLRNHVYAIRKPTAGGNTAPPPFTIKTLGEPTYDNFFEAAPYSDGISVLRTPLFKDGVALASNEFVELSGPRSKLFFDPTKSTAGIVTCGGLCPGLNNVIRALYETLVESYKVQRVLGFMYGYEGLTPLHTPIELTYEMVKDIHTKGGSILGTSRGQQKDTVMVDCLVKYHVDMLFVIGGDGTQQGALAIAREVERRGLKISIVGLPKTIDNDLSYSDVTFGFQTAVARAQEAIYAVHDEAKSALGGIGIVKLMGRDAGFIALHAALSNGDVNMVLIPEVEFTMEAVNAYVEKRLARPDRGHCVIVVAEGAGQHLLKGTPDEFDRSGNRLQKDIGRFLVSEINHYLTCKGIEHTIKYVDPSYIIRSAVAIPSDAMLCILLAVNAVHAALSGRTELVICHHNNTFINVPIERAVFYIKRMNPNGPLYRTFLDISHMPSSLCVRPKGLTLTPDEYRAEIDMKKKANSTNPTPSASPKAFLTVSPQPLFQTPSPK